MSTASDRFPPPPPHVTCGKKTSAAAPAALAQTSRLSQMAQLLSPVCADVALRLSSGVSLRRRRLSGGLSRRREWRGAARRGRLMIVAASTYRSQEAEDVADDYYAVLGLLPDATPQQIKHAYYNCMKACHPDLAGDDEDTNNFCMFVNEIYTVLSDPVQRRVYDEIHGFAATPTNPFLDENCTKDHTFVDEFSCIGCKNCTNVAPDVFDMEEDFGRARVYNQCGNTELIQDAINSCPVDCIHWTSAAQLSLLEDEMRRVERVNVGLMLAGMGSSFDVFKMASKRWEKRQSKILEKARMRMTKKDPDNRESYWDNLWGKPKDHEAGEDETKEMVRKTAAAARRWREYSRKGVDRQPIFQLPEAMSNIDN